ncbi:MAG: TetR/AcrR family transcriptional regulator [Solirubrobacteraceae bacterium]
MQRLQAGSSVTEPLYARLQPAPHRMTVGEVAASQRERLCGAMVHEVALHGYREVTVSRLHRLAGVSKHTLYDRFGRADARGECLRAAIDGMLEASIAGALVAQRRGRGWRDRMALTLGALARDVARHPDAARVMLIEAYDPRADALETLVRGGERLEELFAGCFDEVPVGEDPPPLIVKGILAGATHVARVHLLSGRERELPRRVVDELAAWACACCTPAPSELMARVASVSPGHARVGALPSALAYLPREISNGASAHRLRGREHICDERLRMLEACSRLAGEEGYASLSISAIEKSAQVPRGTFRRHFASVRECFIGACELRCNDLLAQGFGKVHRVHRARSAEGLSPIGQQIADQLAACPEMARVACSELLAAGPAGVRAQTRILDTFARVLADRMSRNRRSSPIALSAGVAAMCGVAGHLAAHGRVAWLQANRHVLVRLMPLTVTAGWRAGCLWADTKAQGESLLLR